ncbi:MAG: hypothetical protein IJ091_02255, partial [Oscillospiraceae bacterium]|nr:hypothetical protein [Oscillospiraceae bacterium]
YLNSAVLKIAGNTFANSIFSTTFVGWTASFLLFAALLTLYTDDKKTAACGSLLMMMVILLFAPVQSMGFIAGNPILSKGFSFLDKIFSKFAVLFLPGNSSRPTRMAVIGLYLAIFSALYPNLKWKKEKYWVEPVLFGILGGIMILWANDYGSASYVGASFCFFLIVLKKTGFWNAVKESVIYVAATLTTVFLIMMIVTKGHVGYWFRQTFSITDFLWWYDGVFFDRKRLGFWEYPPFSGECLIPIMFAVGSLLTWILLLFQKDELEKRAAKHIMLLTTAFVYLYLNLFKNGYEEQYTNIFIVYAYLSVFFFVVDMLKKLVRGEKAEKMVRTILAMTGLMVMAVALLYSANSIRYAKANLAPTEAYIEALDGNCYSWYRDLNLAYEQVGNSTLFSTYGSALEVMKGTQQPSRYDYITHVYGNQARGEYLEAFREMNPEYVSILNRDYTRWEAWACDANWFFYREILDHYQFSFANTFCRYLKKTEESNVLNVDIRAEIIPVSSSQVKIRLTSSETTTRQIADISLAYTTSLVNGSHRLLTVNRLVAVTGPAEYLYPKDNFDAWFLPNSSEGYWLPILIEDGVGEITLTVYPEECAELVVDSVYVNKVCDFEKVFGVDSISTKS